MKLKCHQKYLFSSTTKIKCRKTKFLDQNAKLKCHEKKHSSAKKKLQEKHILSSVFLNLTKLGMFFQKQGFNFLNEKNKQTCPTLTSQMGRTMKRFVLKRGEAWLKRDDFT